MPGQSYYLMESLRLSIKRYDSGDVIVAVAVDAGAVEVRRDAVAILGRGLGSLELASTVARCLISCWVDGGELGLESALADVRQLVKED